MIPGSGPIWAHVVSRDLIHWARLPIAIWNDQPYDNIAIFTGSTTIVNGVPHIIYPGLCNTTYYPECETGIVAAIAIPSDMNDPFFTNWTKPDYNPIIKNSSRDPTTAW